MRERLALLAAVALSSWARADVFSPGELSRAHQSLEGIRNCSQCHPAGGQLSQETCLECHTELKGRVAKGNGLHGRIPEEKRNCEECHKEHQGKGFDIVDWGKAGKTGFDHGRSGWPLKGKHASVQCETCHQPKRVLVPLIQELLAKHPDRVTFLGLRTKCEACHFDEHRGQLKADCDYCHREASWKPPSGFTHDETKYPLKGKHQKVECAKCHPTSSDPEPGVFPAPVSETFLKLNQLDFKQCSDCHKDPHDNSLGARCSSCHTVEGWKIIRNAAAERSFHEKTRYPLKGEHLEVACNACHGPFPGIPARFKGLPFSRCNDCHVDAHQGQLSPVNARGTPPDCAACHSVDGFLPAKFTQAQHEKTKYPLEGSHKAVACTACHAANPALKERISEAVQAEVKRKHRKPLFSMLTFDFKGSLQACDTCHKDPHQNQFDARAGGCAKCHGLESFHALRFDHQKDSSFHLEGKHAEVPCEKCHAPAKAGEPLVYTPLQSTCESCHADPHARQFGDARCETCHTLKDFKTLAFQHQPPFTTFVLEGKHRDLACVKCHPMVKVRGAKPVQRFTGAPAECEGCHKDFHQGAFKGFEPP